MTLSITRGSETITAYEEFGKAYLAIRETLADSDCWRAIVADPTGTSEEIKAVADGDTSALRTAALNAIYLERIENEGEEVTTPIAVIRASLPNIATAVGPDTWDITGTFDLFVRFEIPESARSHNDLGAEDFAEKASRIWRELRQANKSGGERMAFDVVQMTSMMGQLDPNEVGGKWVREAEFQFSYQSEDISA